jgi:hypothetical protein
MDMTPDGFSAPRQPPDDIEDSKLIIQRLALFHAASFFLAENVSNKIPGASSVVDHTLLESLQDGDTFRHFLKVL